MRLKGESEKNPLVLRKPPVVGYPGGLNDKHLYASFNHNYLKGRDRVWVKYGNEVRSFTKKDIVSSREVPDKWKPEMTTIYYFLWKKR